MKKINCKSTLARKVTFFMICCLFSISSFAQRVTLKSQTTTLAQAMAQIERQTGYKFFYDNSQINTNRTVKVGMKNEALTSALDKLFGGSDISYKLVDKTIALTKKKASSNGGNQPSKSSTTNKKQKITGKVLDNNGEPVIGATIMENGTANGTVTDIDGNFSLDVDEESSVKISYIGFLAQTVKATSKPMTITMAEDRNDLDEVVVVGYGTQKKSDLTGAVARADLAAMKTTPNVNLLNTLKSTVPGLNIGIATSAGDSPSISIRGRNSISGTTEPLIVLDGIIYRGNLSDINPADIQSIDVLKDASSAAIYGSQAANGVILITSKIPEKNSKPVIEYNGTFTFQKLMTDDMKPLTRDEYLTQLEHADINHSRLGPDYLEKNPDWSPLSLMIRSSVQEGYENGTDFDWWDATTNDLPYINNQNVSIRGRGDRNSYYISFGFLDQKNIFKNDKYRRYNFRVNYDTQITDWLKIGTQSFFSSNDTSGLSPSYWAVSALSPLSSPYDANGELLKELDLGVTNPLLVIKESDLDRRYNLTGNFYVDISCPWVKGLSYRMNYSHNFVWTRQYGYDPYDNSQQGSAHKDYTHEEDMTFDNILTYKNRFGKHDVSGTFVYGVERRKYDSTNSEANIFNNGTLGYNYLQAAQSDQSVLASSAWKETSIYMMGRIGYTYNDRYIFNATLRRDGFSGFGENNKFAWFPSAAVAWRISEEKFMEGTRSWLDNLKLRVSYGKSGNRTASRYSTLATVTTTNGYVYGNGSPELRSYLNAMSNPDLKWETTSSTNIGLDFSFLGNRLFGSFETYFSSTHNLLYNVQIPIMNGSANVATNIGKIANHGFEFALTGVIIDHKDWHWTMSGTFSLNRNKVKSILGRDDDGDGKEDDLVSASIFINKPYGVIYDYNAIGIWQIADAEAGIIPNGYTFGTYKYEDINGDGKYTADADRKIIGYTDPSYRFSITNTVGWKNFELRAVINSAQGGKHYFYADPLKIYTGEQIRNYSFFNCFDYWLPENPNARYQRLDTDTSVKVDPYQQRNFIRLQELSLTYNLPKSLLSKIKINSARVFVTANNLFTITGWDGWDPESGTAITTSNAPTKQYSVGVNFEF